MIFRGLNVTSNSPRCKPPWPARHAPGIPMLQSVECSLFVSHRGRYECLKSRIPPLPIRMTELCFPPAMSS